MVPYWSNGMVDLYHADARALPLPDDRIRPAVRRVPGQPRSLCLPDLRVQGNTATSGREKRGSVCVPSKSAGNGGQAPGLAAEGEEACLMYDGPRCDCPTCPCNVPREQRRGRMCDECKGGNHMDWTGRRRNEKDEEE